MTTNEDNKTPVYEMDRLVRTLNALLIIIYSIMIFTAFGLQIFKHEEPCPLCYLQRIGMISVSAGAFFNLVFGVRPYHYCLSLLSALFGGGVALRQIALHVCPGFPQFGIPMFGLSLYTWSFLSFVCSVLLISLLIGLYRPSQTAKPQHLNWFERAACSLLLLIVLGNIASSLIDCRLTLCGN